MNNKYILKVAKDRLSVSIQLYPEVNENEPVTYDEIHSYLQHEKINYGIKQDVINSIVKDPNIAKVPITVAEGISPQNGEDGYIVNEYTTKQNEENENGRIDFRNVMKIPSVKKGQLLAKVIQPTQGIPGVDVYGNKIPAKNGRPSKVRAGKNVLSQLDEFYATLDGQVSHSTNAIQVLPVYELRGDLDMSTGNIDFIGNVTINGNVPNGFHIKAGGDIRINGLVEGAFLEAGGSITVSGGVAGANRGKLLAAHNVNASYLNQVTVTAANDIFVEKSILHSQIHAGKKVLCERGHIIGGQITAGLNITAKEIGNHLYTKTHLYLGWTDQDDLREKSLIEQNKRAKESLDKINLLLAKIAHNQAQIQLLSNEQRQMLSKQAETKKLLEQQSKEINEQLVQLEHDKVEKRNAELIVTGVLHPNSIIYIGKALKITQQAHQYSKFYLNESKDITFEAL